MRILRWARGAKQLSRVLRGNHRSTTLGLNSACISLTLAKTRVNFVELLAEVPPFINLKYSNTNTMKTCLITILAAVAAVTQLAAQPAQPSITSIIQTSTNQTNIVHIADFQYVKVLTAVDQQSSGAIHLGGATFSIPSLPNGNGPFGFIWNSQWQTTGIGSLVGLALAGPADVTITSGSATRTPSTPLLVTLEIGPGAYSVTNSVTLGPGQGAAINLESSTDLVTWASATNGVYTVPAAMFFRLHLQRIQ
jgi:hypothetical protein